MNPLYTLDLDSSRSGLTLAEITELEAKLRGTATPFFATYAPDFSAIESLGKRYREKKNIIIEGNGGSISTLRAFYSCLATDAGQQVFLLDTSDPSAITEIKKRCPVEDTLLIVISKSGESIDALAAYLALQEYETALVTGPSGALFEIGKIKELALFNHPDISGRFSGITECALFPAAVLGCDTQEIARGAQEMYAACAPDSPYASNPALRLAAHLDKLEKIGYDEIFLSIYSRKLNGFFELIVQLFHESVCKQGKGQTFYGGEAPENQHHTLQRFNSGKKNSVGLFLTVEDLGENAPLSVPEELRGIPCRNIRLGQLDQRRLSDILHTEFEGTWEDTRKEEIPAINLQLQEISPMAAGALVALFQYATFYSALLRDVNPFDQPGVEKSKEYIFRLLGEARSR